MDDEQRPTPSGGGREPWLPPGHAERLTVGARVRVKRGGECPRAWCRAPSVFEGDGIIESMLPPEIRLLFDDHSYVVKRGDGHLSRYAAAELEPLD